jgi:pantoate kinase
MHLASTLPLSVVFCPAGISSFFETCRRDEDGNPVTDPTRIGARGGGFAIMRGVTSKVTVKRRDRTRIRIRINSKPSADAHTTRSAIEQLISENGVSLDVAVDIRVRVPIAAGFGTSAAGTLASCLALADAGNLPMTFNEVGCAAHVAEVLNGTGLGTVSALLCGGFVLVREPGAPGIGVIDRLRFPADHSIVCGYLGPIQTREALAKQGEHATYGSVAHATFEAISKNPTLPFFLAESRKFGKRSGFETPRITNLISTMMCAGAIGAAQNMVGEAVHAVVEDSKTAKVLRAVKRAFPDAKVFLSSIDGQGVRLLS